eukprot:3785396-Rhodomonas_salina.1
MPGTELAYGATSLLRCRTSNSSLVCTLAYRCAAHDYTAKSKTRNHNLPYARTHPLATCDRPSAVYVSNLTEYWTLPSELGICRTDIE